MTKYFWDSDRKPQHRYALAAALLLPFLSLVATLSLWEA